MAPRAKTHPHLTSRQREILNLIERGKTNIEIASQLGIGFETVKTHVSRLLAELGVESREEAAAWWRSEGRSHDGIRGWLGLSMLKVAGAAAASVVLVAGGFIAWVYATGGGQRDSNPSVAGLPEEANAQPGILNVNAVAEVNSFTEFPILWLGEEFRGFNLVAFIRRTGPSPDAVTLIYGDCEPAGKGDSRGCVPPLQITIHRRAPEVTAEVAARVGDDIESVRDVPAQLEGGPQEAGGLVVWTATTEVSVSGNFHDRDAAAQELQLANSGVLGIAPIGPGQSLAPLWQ